MFDSNIVFISVAVHWHPLYEEMFASGGSDGSIMFWLMGLVELFDVWCINVQRIYESFLGAEDWNCKSFDSENSDFFGFSISSLTVVVFSRSNDWIKFCVICYCSLPFVCSRCGKELGLMNQAHDGMIWDLKWHPLGHILCSASNDHTTYFLSLFFVAYFYNPVSRRMVFFSQVQ